MKPDKRTFKSFFSYLFTLGETDSSRLAWIDYAKGLAILMIVFKHVNTGLALSGVPIDDQFLDGAKQLGYTFRMPLYFMLSGMFFQRSFEKRGASGYIAHKFRSIMYPYFLWYLIFIFIQLILSGYVNTEIDLFPSILEMFYKPWGHWWFLYVLFVDSILYLILMLLFRKKAIVFVLGLVFYSVSLFIGDYFLLDEILSLFVFLSMGDLTAKFLSDEKNLKNISRPMLLSILIVISLTGEWLLFTTYRDQGILVLVFAFIGIITACSLCYRISLNSNTYSKILRVIGQHSLYIYLLHALATSATRIVLVEVFVIKNLIVLELICFVNGVIIPVLLFRFFNYFRWSFLFYPSFLNKKVQQE